MNYKKFFDLKRQINKPEYFFNPSQLIQRMGYRNQGRAKVLARVDSANAPFYVNENEVIGRSILTMGVYDLIVAESLKRLLEPEDFFLDIGANIGYFSRLALSYGAKIKSFEPHPIIYQKLSENLNGLPGEKELLNIALSDKKGEFSLYVPQDFEKNEGIASLEFMENSTEVKVSTERLDSLGLDKIKLIKIDVEGHELSVFKGASSLLEQKRIENIVFEDFNGASSPSIQYLQDYGYQVMRLQKTLAGPNLLNLDNIDHLPTYEPPNFMATVDSASLKEAFRQKGWSFYR